MAASSALTAMRVPGTVTVGGTEIGLLRDVQLRRKELGGRVDLTAEEYAGEVVDVMLGAVAWELGMALRGFDATAIAAVFPNVAGGKVKFPGTKAPGYWRSKDAVAVVFTPLESSHPSISIGSAIPLVAEDLIVDLGKRAEHLILCKFLVTRESGELSWG